MVGIDTRILYIDVPQEQVWEPPFQNKASPINTFHEDLPFIFSVADVFELGSRQLYSPVSSIRRSWMISILFLPSTRCSYLPPSGSSWTPLYHMTSALGFDTSQIILMLSVSVPSTLDRFFVNIASSSVKTMHYNQLCSFRVLFFIYMQNTC